MITSEFTMESLINSDKFPLTSLPTLVFEKVLQFLDFTSLKRLRLVCKWTKSVIEHPHHIKRLTITLQDRDRLLLVVQSQPGWNSFSFLVSDNFPLESDVSEWGTLFGNTARSLSLLPVSETFSGNNYRFAQVVKALLLTCSTIESVTVDELDFTKIPSSDWAVILQNWKHLRSLRVARIVFISNQTRSYFGDIVRSTSHLQLVTLPRLQASLNSVSSVPVALHNQDDFQFHDRSLIQEYEDLVLSPLVQRITDELHSTSTHKTTIKILFCAEELVFRETYFELACLCTKAGITLHYSQPPIIPSHILHHQPPEENALLLLSRCIGSISGVNESVLTSPFDNLNHISINNGNFLFTSDGPYSPPSFPRLESISMQLSSWSSLQRDKEPVKRLSAFINCLQSGNLSSVRSAYISRFPQSDLWSCPHANLVRPYLLLSFVNLTQLDLEGVTYLPEEYTVLWATLQKLERVKLKSCFGVNDLAIVGNCGQMSCPSMAQLTGLKSLTLDEVGQITCISYKQVFSKMRLLHLCHNPRIMDFPIDESAFVALVYGSVWEHLERFECMGIGFTSSAEKARFSCNFQNSYILSLDTIMREADKRSEEIARKMSTNGCLCC